MTFMSTENTTQSMPTEAYSVGTAIDKAGKIRVTSIEALGINYQVTLSTGYVIVVPPRYIAAAS